LLCLPSNNPPLDTFDKLSCGELDWCCVEMTHAIIRGQNGRRHEVDFADAPIRVEVYASEETVEIFVEADSETLAEERRRFAILNNYRLTPVGSCS
jgi:hypothetical protein